MPTTTGKDGYRDSRKCCECGKQVTIWIGDMNAIPGGINGHPKMVPDQDLNSERVGWICSECADKHYQNGDAAWGGDGSLLMMPSYYD